MSKRADGKETSALFDVFDLAPVEKWTKDERWLAVDIARRIGDNPFAFPGVKTLASDTGLSESFIYEHLPIICADSTGLLLKQSGNSRRSNRYFPNPRIAERAEAVRESARKRRKEREDSAGRTPDLRGADSSTPPGGDQTSAGRTPDLRGADPNVSLNGSMNESLKNGLTESRTATEPATPLTPVKPSLATMFVMVFNAALNRNVGVTPEIERRVAARIKAGYRNWQIISLPILVASRPMDQSMRNTLRPDILLRDGKRPHTTAAGYTAGATDWLERELQRLDTTVLDENLTHLAIEAEVAEPLRKMGVRMAGDAKPREPFPWEVAYDRQPDGTMKVRRLSAEEVARHRGPRTGDQK